MNSVIEYLSSKLSNGDTIIVACSGGPDSMCLLSCALNVSKDIKIICAHVNHNIRKESILEYNYLKEYCLNNNIIFEGTELKEKYSNNFESNARKFRYEYFESLKEKYNAKYILTAHHGDDLIETILMRITRGSTLSGYVGIKMEDNYYLRPLLNYSKKDIIEYLDNNNIKYFIDNTNNEDVHTRNRYRHNILPFLKNENEQIHKKYLKFSNTLEEYDNFLKKYIIENKFIENNRIVISRIINEDDIVIKKAIELLIKEVQKDYILDVSDNITNEAVRIIKSNKPNLKIDLPGMFVIVKSYDELFISTNDKVIDYDEIFEDYFENNEWIIKKENENNTKNNFVIRLDSSEIKLPIHIRSRKEKDRISLKNSGTKKIKDIFIDEKVKLDKRDTYPIVTDFEGTILWLPGLKKSKFDKEITEKYDIILSSERKNV